MRRVSPVADSGSRWSNTALKVYKTFNATMPTGGIGSTINIKTTKPLESNDRTLSFGIKAVNDTSTEAGDSWTPEISGIYVDQFADGKFGLAITAIYGLELLVSVVQAYVFAILTCVYLNDALHPGH